MTTEEYKELNNYLNDIFLELSKNDSFLINNIEFISKINDTFLFYSDKYKIKNENKENKLTYEEVYLLAREIIESIDKKYLPTYDKLIKSGELNFDYDQELSDSSFLHITREKDSINLIDIRREFNYIDVITLVHEYFHYTNGYEDQYSINRYLLTEFISIYFEMYAFDYLLDKGIPKEELKYNDRLDSIYKHSEELNSYELVLLSYSKFGNIDENTVNYLNKYICGITKEDFEQECKTTLNNLKKIEKRYNSEIGSQEYFDQKKFGLKLVEKTTVNYRYVLGTLFAIYAKKYSSIDKMIYLNDTISQNFDELYTIFKNIDIDINDDNFKNNMVNCIEEYLSRFNSKKEIK